MVMVMETIRTAMIRISSLMIQLKWFDRDDGLGDNQLGNNPDPHPDDRENDGFDDDIDDCPDHLVTVHSIC